MHTYQVNRAVPDRGFFTVGFWGRDGWMPLFDTEDEWQAMSAASFLNGGQCPDWLLEKFDQKR